MDKLLSEHQRRPEKFPRSEKIVKGSDGWLSPSGFFYKADKTEHDESADWIIKNNYSELSKKYRHLVSKSDLQRWKDSDLPQREFLRDNGWILINGQIFRTDNALNYTSSQLAKLAEADIPIVGAFDGSKEFSSQETIEWIKKTTKRISKFLNEQELGTWTPFEKKIVNQNEFWKNIGSRGYSTLKDFEKDPFRTEFGDFGSVKFTDVRDILTKGYQDEMVFDYDMETYTFRLVKLNSGERICVEYTFHHHDRDSGNEEHMNAYVVDDFTFKQKINQFIHSGIEPRIEGEYFKRLVEDK